MNLYTDTRTRLYVDMVLDTDPTGATVELSIDGTWYPCDWQVTPVKGKNRDTGRDEWKQTARTSGYLAGPTAVATAGEMLTVGRHVTETRVTWAGGDTITAPSTPIDVRNI